MLNKELEYRMAQLIAHPSFSPDDISVLMRTRDEIGALNEQFDPGRPKILPPLEPYSPDDDLPDELKKLEAKYSAIETMDRRFTETINAASVEIKTLRSRLG